MSQRDELPTSGANESDQNTETYSTRHDWENEETLSHSVVLAVAEATGTDPDSMQPLYETIEPEALNDLFQQRDGGSRQPRNGRIAFQYEECNVTVYADGRTVVSRIVDDE